METQIGDAAGSIWRYLNQHKGTTLKMLKQEMKLSDQLLLMGLGWLAREKKLTFVQDGRKLKVALKGD